MKFPAMEAHEATASPAHGEHTGEILRQHGYGDEDVADLRERGVVR